MRPPIHTTLLEPHQENWTLLEFYEGNTFLEFFPSRGLSVKPTVIFWLNDHCGTYGDDFNYFWSCIDIYDGDGLRVGYKHAGDGRYQHRVTFAFRDPQHALLFKLSH